MSRPWAAVLCAALGAAAHPRPRPRSMHMPWLASTPQDLVEEVGENFYEKLELQEVWY